MGRGAPLAKLLIGASVRTLDPAPVDDPLSFDGWANPFGYALLYVDDRAGIVQAWGQLDDSRTQGFSTIDTMMNLPLLWWASGETGDASFWRAAARHARVSAAVYIREDGSTFHTARFDPVTGVLMDRGT